MPLGDLDRRIKIQSASTTYNGYGEPVSTWTTTATVWAGKTYATTPEKFASDELIAFDRINFMVRFNSSFTTQCRVIYNEVQYDIKSIEEVDRKRYMILSCEGADNTTHIT